MGEPLVSVVVPSYNHARWVIEAVESALGQTHRELEVVVVDDGSTDGSPDRIAEIRDPRLRLEVQPNRGAHAAINRGLELARGDLLAVLNSDDAYAPRRVERLLAALRANPGAGVGCSWIQVVDGAGKGLAVKEAWRNLEPWSVDRPGESFQAQDEPVDNLLMWNWISTTSNLLFRRDVLGAVGPFRNLRYAHDWDWALRASSVTGIALVEEPLLRYRLHGANTIRENREAMIFEVLLVLADNYRRFGAAARLDLDDPAALARRAALHLQSLYTFGNDRLFFVLHFLLESARARGLPLAERLMEPANPVRAWCLAEIARGEGERSVRPSAGEGT